MTLFFSALAAFLLSVTAKALADHFLDHRIAIIGSFAGLRLSHNPGVAFGLQFHPVLQTILIMGAFAAVLFVAVKSAKSAISRIAFGLIIGGALGNIVDRLSDGLVADFFQVGTFPIFNVADSCISIGAGLLILEAAAGWWRRKG